MTCYVCGQPVPVEVHTAVKATLDAIVTADVPGIEDAFTHLLAVELENLDEDENVVFCPKCLVEELGRTLKPTEIEF